MLDLLMGDVCSHCVLFMRLEKRLVSIILSCVCWPEALVITPLPFIFSPTALGQKTPAPAFSQKALCAKAERTRSPWWRFWIGR